jgi:hypothetical protein
VAALKSRNPSLANASFLLPRGQVSSIGIDPRPYPIISTTMIGPFEMLPSLPVNRNWTLLEFTPLAIGVALSSVVQYSADPDSDEDPIFAVVGGFVEPFSFGGDPSPTVGLSQSQSTGQLSVPAFSPVADLALASGSSSWAAGAAVGASDVPLTRSWSGTVDYWAPSASDPSANYAEYVISDGAGVSNTNLISLLQRGVKKIIAFVSTSSPLMNSTHWDPATAPLSKENIDFTASAWFGQIPYDLGTIDLTSYDLNNSQVFGSEQWLPFATGLQDAQAVGNGNVLSMQHTTVKNEKYGIEAGMEVTVVWFYLGRCLQWESQLSDEMRNLVVPEEDPENQASLRRLGPFTKFPHYTTAVASLSNEEANLLADLTGWTLYKHEALLRDVFAESSPSESSGGNESFIETTTGQIALAFIIFGGILILVVFFFLYRKYNSASGSSVVVRKDLSLASQDTSGRESEMMSTFTGSVLS